MVFQDLREKEEDEFRQIVCLRVEKFLFDFLAVFKGFLFQVDQRRAFELQSQIGRASCRERV